MVFMLLFFAALVLSFLFFDALLRRQTKDYPEEWKRDGCPWGFFFFTRSGSFWEGCKARNTVLRKWLFTCPDWAAKDPKAVRLLWGYKILSAAGLVFWLFAAIALFKKGS